MHSAKLLRDKAAYVTRTFPQTFRKQVLKFNYYREPVQNLKFEILTMESGLCDC